MGITLYTCWTLLGLAKLPWPMLIALVAILAAYVVTADRLKIWFFKKYRIDTTVQH